ncbi:MAG: oligosaccharide repeat unit polymerase [Comamonadaceae bacterium]|nr:oligosaccharide repeat unit polymerase [Comamonadaceae bacterium]
MTTAYETHLIVGLIATFLGFFFFDYGKAETQSTLPFGFVFRLIPTDLLFAFYFCTVPLNRAKPYILVAAYLALKVSMGWTGMFAGVFWTLFIRIINANQHRKWITTAGITVLALAFLLGPVVYSVKFYLRWGTYEFAYLEALTRLVGRMGFYSNGLYLWENASRFAHEAAARLTSFFVCEGCSGCGAPEIAARPAGRKYGDAVC